MLAGKKLGVIGVGKLGEALVSGLLKESVIRKEDIAGSVNYENSMARVKERLGIDVTLDNRAAAQHEDVVLVAVKPQNMDHVVREIAPVMQSNQVLITVAASVPTTFVEERLAKGYSCSTCDAEHPMCFECWNDCIVRRTSRKARTSANCGKHFSMRRQNRFPGRIFNGWCYRILRKRTSISLCSD